MPRTLASLRDFFRWSKEVGAYYDAGVLKCSDLLKVLNRAKSHTPAQWKKYFKAYDALIAHSYTDRSNGLDAKFKKEWASYVPPGQEL